MIRHARDTLGPLHVAIIGAGAMGVSLAAMLGRRTPVTLVVRDSARAVRIDREGVRVTGLMNASAHPRVAPSITALRDAGPLDVIFVATKTTAINSVASEWRPVLDKIPAERHPFFVSFQNGIETGRDLMLQLAEPRVLRMALNYGATLDDDLTARVMLNSPPHFIGGPDTTHLPFAQRLADLLTACDLPTRAVDNIEPHVWAKGVLNAATNPVAALTNSSVAEVLDSPARDIVERLIHEGLRVAEAEGIDLGPDIAQRLWSTLEAARPHTPSMVGDIRNGRPSEVGQLNRQIIRHAQRAGVRVPSHEVIAALIDAFDWRVFQRRSSAPAAAPTLLHAC